MSHNLVTSLYYYRARYYDPNVGRFLIEDPLGFAGMGPNFYAYVRNDPTYFVDPFGLRPLTECEKKLLSPYFPEKDLDLTDLHEKEWPPKVWKFIPVPLSKDVVAITLENDIYVRPGAYDASTVSGIALLGHELTHVGQYNRGGLTRAKYIRELLKHGSGPDNKYEKPAYDKEDQLRNELTCGCTL